MPSVRSTTASRSPRAAHRSSENQYGPIMAHALESVRRRLILAPSEGVGWGAPGPWPFRPRRSPTAEFRSSSSLSRFLPTSRHRTHGWLRLRPAAVALEATALLQGDATAVRRGVSRRRHSLETLGGNEP